MKNQTIRKLAAAVAMSLVVGASLVACGGKTESTAASSVTKTGTGKGFGGDITATLTVEADGTVSDCKLEGEARPRASAVPLWRSWLSRWWLPTVPRSTACPAQPSPPTA